MADESVALGLPREENLDTQFIAQISSPPHQLIHCGTPKKSGITPFVVSIMLCACVLPHMSIHHASHLIFAL